MSDINNIDDLFKSKLEGREVAYSAAAWSGAEKMLAKHYKFLFLKKLLMLLIPVAAILAAGLVYMFSGEQVETADVEWIESSQPIESTSYAGDFEREKNSNIEAIQASNAENEQVSDKEPETTNGVAVLETSIKSNNSASLKSQAVDADSKSSENQKLDVANAIVEKLEPAKAESVIKTDHSVQMPPGFDDFLDDMDLGFDELEDQPEAALAQTVSLEVAKLRFSDHLDLMSGFEISLGNHRSTLLTPNRFGEPFMKELRKIQLFGEFGALGAPGYHDLGKKRMAPSAGLHVQALAMYHVSQSLHFDLGLGLFNRGSLTKNSAFTGNVAGSQIDITPVSANYASIFVGFGHRFGARHTVGGGMQINPLIAVIAKEEYSATGEPTTSKYISDKNGFQSFDAAAVVNYRFSFAERWDATAAMQLGFLDATDNAVFKSGDVNDYNTLIKFGLSYRLTSR